MKIDIESSRTFNTQQVRAFDELDTDAISFSSAFSSAIANSSTTKQVDFHNMTRMDMAEWANSQIRSGQMSVEESIPFRVMNMRIPVEEGQAIDISTDPTKIDFFERASSIVEFARSSNDPVLAKKLQAAIDKMYRYQGQATNINVRA